MKKPEVVAPGFSNFTRSALVLGSARADFVHLNRGCVFTRSLAGTSPFLRRYGTRVNLNGEENYVL